MDAEKVIEPLNPFTPVTVIVEVPDEPGGTVSEVGFDESE
jgi:hypothetical protein